MLEAIERLGYHPNPVARALRSGATWAVGLTVRSLRLPSTADFVEAAVGVLSPEGYAVSVSDAIRDANIEQAAVADFLKRRFDGIIALNPISMRHYRQVREAGVPLVPVLSSRVGQRTAKNAILFSSDDAGRQLFGRLAALGHRRVNFVTPRRSFYRGIPGPQDGSIEVARVNEPTSQGSFSDEEVTRHVLTGGATAIVIRAESAPPTLDALRRLGLGWPEDISVAVWGDATWSRFTHPPIDSVATDFGGIGLAAGTALLDVLLGRPRTIVRPFSARYFPGESIGRPSSTVLRRLRFQPGARPVVAED